MAAADAAAALWVVHVVLVVRTTLPFPPVASVDPGVIFLAAKILHLHPRLP